MRLQLGTFTIYLRFGLTKATFFAGLVLVKMGLPQKAGF